MSAKQSADVLARARTFRARVREAGERRYGELLKQLARAPGECVDKLPAAMAVGSPYRQAIERDNVSERAAQRRQSPPHHQAP